MQIQILSDVNQVWYKVKKKIRSPNFCIGLNIARNNFIISYKKKILQYKFYAIVNKVDFTLDLSMYIILTVFIPCMKLG